MSGNRNARITLGVAAALIVVLGAVWLVRGIYSGSWWLANDSAKRSYQLQTKNADRQAHLVQHNYGTQEGYQAKIQADIADVVSDIAQIPGAPDGPALKTEAINAGDDACFYAEKLVPSSVPVPPQMNNWITANCSFGTLKISSPIRSGSVG